MNLCPFLIDMAGISDSSVDADESKEFHALTSEPAGANLYRRGKARRGVCQSECLKTASKATEVRT